jgi:hypothetical protein
MVVKIGKMIIALGCVVLFYGCEVNVEEVKCSSEADCNDGLSCTQDSCDKLTQYCTHEIKKDTCLIGETAPKCWAKGDVNSDADFKYDYGTIDTDSDMKCFVCDPSQSQEFWSPKCQKNYKCGSDNQFTCELKITE